MTTLNSVMKKLICKVFGHKISDIELLMFKIECEGATDYIPEITCPRCKKTWRKKIKEETHE